jgi:hypothetical protein
MVARFRQLRLLVVPVKLDTSQRGGIPSNAFRLTRMLRIREAARVALSRAPPKAIFVPSFKFTPTAQPAAPGSANVSFALLKPTYSSADPWTTVFPYSDFATNMSGDFQEVLSSRGFTVRGPFGTYDEMAFPDKKGSDLALQPTLELKLNTLDQGTAEKVNLLSANSLVTKYQVSFKGRVNLAIIEPLSKERMWFKTIDVQGPSPVVLSVEHAAGTVANALDVVNATAKDETFVKAIDQAYNSIVQATWTYLDPGEMQQVKKQADEIKAKKVY